MKEIYPKLKAFFKYMLTKETVTSVSFVLAVISLFFVPVDKKYLDYIDFKTLGLLLGLMLVMAGLKEIGVFAKAGKFLLKRTNTAKGLTFTLVALCFFLSMFITNDVALITFVPFTIEILEMADLKKYAIKIITLQTIAANLGSMLLPTGSPHNLYLYECADISMGSFVNLMLRYWLESMLMLIVCIFIIIGKEKVELASEKQAENNIKTDENSADVNFYLGLMYGFLFVAFLMTVLKVLPYYIPLAVTVVLILIADRKTILKADYFLILTFCFLFVFIGNISRVETVSHFLQKIVDGHERIVMFLASQFMSNVPASILLSGFSDNFHELIIGANIGGLGSLIASMASLISFKIYAASKNSKVGKYIGYFTVVNLIFAAVLFFL